MFLTDAVVDEEDPISFLEGVPSSRQMDFNPDLWSEVEWARHEGIKSTYNRPHEIEGAWFIPLGDECWIVSVKGAQFLHSDRHMATLRPEQQGHCWNAVIEADGDQMLLVRESESAYRHHRLNVGSLIYFNTYQAHLVSRSDPQDRCVIVQIGGVPPDQPEVAVARMRAAVAKRQIASDEKTAA